jgi:hypothetical protein
MSSKAGGTIEGRGLYSKSDNGGLIYISGDGTNVNFYNVTITNGRAGSGYGGNVYITKGAATFENCVISDGTASRRGGNICVEGSSTDRGELTIINCTITGGAASGWTETKVVYSNGYADVSLTNVTSEFVAVAANTTLNVYGGTYGYLYAAAAATTHIYGGAISNLAGKEVVNVHNAYVATTSFTADTNGAIAAGADTLVLDEAEGGKFYYHAAGACATCGVTYTGDLDLKGKTVTVPEGKTLDVSVAGNIIDSVGGGKLVGNVMLNPENTMLPIAVEGGYAFEDVTAKQGFLEAFAPGAEEVKYAFYIDKAADKTAIDEALAAGTLKLDVLVKWTNAEGEHSQTFTLAGQTLTDYTTDADNWNNKMLCLTLTGLEGVTALTCTATVSVASVVSQ